MGIYGALSTAVTGLRAQSFALENISGNIANSQTTGYKRVETDFLDLIPDAPLKRQIPGAVLAQSRGTNTVQGDVKTSSIDTNIALNGSGFFVVEPRIGQADGNSIFAGANYFTRRGDFDMDKNGYLVNGAGYYLKGLPIDTATGNVSGSVPEVIRISNAFLPAQTTTRINYSLNLPSLPQNGAYKPGAEGSELFQPGDFMALAPDTPATAGGAALTGANDADTVMAAGESLVIDVNGTSVTFDFYDSSAAAYAGANIGIDIDDTTPITITQALTAIQNGLRASGGAAAADATVAIDGGGNLEVTLGTNTIRSMTITDNTTGLGLTDGAYDPVRPSLAARVAAVRGADNDEFIRQSIAGNAVTVYAQNGAPVDVQMRWAKIDSAETGGVERWNLFYMSDSSATGSQPMWTNVGVDYTFGANGSLAPPIETTNLTGLVINGTIVGDVRLEHGANGVTQFADANGTASVSNMSQNGYGAGEFVSVAIADNGRVVASYSNGQQIDLAQVMTANFNAANQLKRLDGGVFAATSESGEPIYSDDGAFIGSALESSNTDISEEFTKLIVTQQAYAAGTRIVSTADEMLQEALNMVR
jgi:flagellar hook protein FlgE